MNENECRAKTGCCDDCCGDG